MANPLNATFFAFRKREKSGVLLGASIAYCVFLVVILAVYAWLNWRAIIDYFSWYSGIMQNATSAGKIGAGPDMASMMPPASVMGLAPSYFLFTLVSYVMLAAYEAACLRWMIRGETGGILGLSFGADTWRVWAGYWMWLVLFIAFYIICLIVGVVLGVGFGVAANNNSSAAGPLVALMPIFGLLVCFALIYFSVRLAPAAATSIGRQKFSFFAAWRVTKGRFWSLFGAFVVLILIYLGAVIVFGGVGGALMGATVFAQMQNTSDQNQVAQMFASPAVFVPLILLYGVILVVAMTIFVCFFGVNARAVLAAAEEGKIDGVTTDVAKTFS